MKTKTEELEEALELLTVKLRTSASASFRAGKGEGGGGGDREQGCAKRAPRVLLFGLCHCILATLPPPKPAFLKEQLLTSSSDVFIPKRLGLEKKAKNANRASSNLVLAHRAFLDPALV